MQSAYQCYRGAVILAWFLLPSCHVASSGFTDSGRAGADGAAGDRSASAGSEEDGDAAQGGEHAGGAGGESQGGHALGSGDAGQAGGGNEAGDAASGAAGSDADAGSVPPDTETAECDVDGGCAPTCTGQTVTCAIESFDNYCEFEVFKDVPKQVACGQVITVGTACCGACGCVDVDLFYDGHECWQSTPACTPEKFTPGQFYGPHAPVP
jgi:hypothetical protein